MGLNQVWYEFCDFFVYIWDVYKADPKFSDGFELKITSI